MKIFRVDFSTKQLLSVEGDSDKSPPLPEKAVKFDSCYKSGVAEISFSTGHSKNIILPLQLKNMPVVALKWSHSYEIADFGIDVTGVYGTLSFSGKCHFIYVPWDCVFRLKSSSTGEEFIWTESIPT